MRQYMVEIKFSDNMSTEFMSLVPEQRNHINQLMYDNKITNYVLSLERSKLWTVVNAENEFAVSEIIESFPLIGYMTYDIYMLTFNNQVSALPQISLN